MAAVRWPRSRLQQATQPACWRTSMRLTTLPAYRCPAASSGACRSSAAATCTPCPTARRPVRSSRSSAVSWKFVESIACSFRNDKVLIKKSLGLAQSFFRKDYGLRLVDRIFDEASFMESVQHILVETFPCAVSVMQGQVEKRQGDFVNCVGIDIHVHSAPAAAFRART
jgi:hypothetical protein